MSYPERPGRCIDCSRLVLASGMHGMRCIACYMAMRRTRDIPNGQTMTDNDLSVLSEYARLARKCRSTATGPHADFLDNDIAMVDGILMRNLNVPRTFYLPDGTEVVDEEVAS